MVPGHGSFKYLAFEPGAEVHGVDCLLGLLENSVVVSCWEECHDAGLQPLDMCEEHAERKLVHKYTLLRPVTISIFRYWFSSCKMC